MQDAYVFSQFAATVFLIVFSVGLGYLKLRYFGFGDRGLMKRQVDYEERRRTRIGKRAHRPRLIRHAENPYYVFGLSIAPTVLNGVGLLVLFWYGQYVLVPVLALPVAIVEFALAWYLQQRFVPLYEADYDRYMRLTDPDHRSFDGTIVEQGDVSNLVSGGRIITASRIIRGGQVTQLRLFVTYEADTQYLVHKASGERLRIFYRPYGTPDRRTSIVIDGELIGLQTKAAPPAADPSYGEFEARVGAN